MTAPYRFVALLALLVCTATIAIAGDVLDLLTLRDRGKRECWIMSETFDETEWRISPENTAKNPPTRRALIRGVTYAFQRQSSGSWVQGMAERDRGSYDTAADLFHQLAQGERECEKVVGSFEEGVSWEMAGKYPQAAAAFQVVVDGFPKHPQNLDALFRLGMVLALGKDAKSEDVAVKLDALSKGMIGLAASARASAIRAAMALATGDAKKFRDGTIKATFNSETERPAWLYYNLFAADGWRKLGQPREAVPIYERMLKGLEDDSANAARVRLGLGLCKADSDPQGAIIDLLALDALPYGSVEEKCEARYNAGRLLLAEAQKGEKDPATAKDDSRKAFVADNFRAARLLLETAASATTSHPSKDAAAELLKTLPVEKVATAPAEEKPAEKPAGK